MHILPSQHAASVPLLLNAHSRNQVRQWIYFPRKCRLYAILHPNLVGSYLDGAAETSQRPEAMSHRSNQPQAPGRLIGN